MNLLQVLQKINSNFLEFVTQDIKDETGNVLGAKCFGVEKDGVVFSGGTAKEKEVAIRVAIAEAFERSYLDVIHRDPKLSQDFDLKNFPSSSGFAAGFDEKSTRFRAICEGLERWVWSKWIDEHFYIPEHHPTMKMSAITNHLLKSFDQTYWFKKDFTVEITPAEKLNLTIVIFLGCKENGIFPGSRVSSAADDLYQHPVIEAHRNLSNAQAHQSSPLQLQDIIQERTMFFAQNKDLAIKHVQAATQTNWPTPSLRLLKQYQTDSSEVFLYRCLFKDFIGWHLGAVDRFVY